VKAPTRAMLLAAGLGTRLRPVTDHVPKCMVPVGGTPLLEHTVRWLRDQQVTDLIINLHYLPHVVTDHFGDGSRWGVRITYSREAEILGTAGAVKHVAWFFDGPFFVWYGDNLCTCRLDRLWEFHRARGGIATIALHHHDDPTKAGIVALGEDQRITRFLEKPRRDEVFSAWANGGIYALEPEVFEAIPAGRAADFGRDVFPGLLVEGAAMYGFRLSGDERFWYVDRPEDLQRTTEHWGPRG